MNILRAALLIEMRNHCVSQQMDEWAWEAHDLLLIEFKKYDESRR